MPYVFNPFTGTLDYYQTASSSASSQAITPTPDGSNRVFSVASAPTSKTMAVLNGQTFVEDFDYTISGTTVTFTVASTPGSFIGVSPAPTFALIQL